MRRATLIGLAFLVGALSLAAWKLTRPAAGGPDDAALTADDDQPRRSKWFWESDEGPERTDVTPARRVARTLRISTEQGDALGNVKVSLLESALLSKLEGHEPGNCDDHEHLTAIAAELRASGASVSLLAEAFTDAEGTVRFPERAWPHGLIVRVEVPGRAPWSMRDYGSEEVLVPDVVGGQATLEVITSNGEPKAGARVTVADLSGGRVFESRTDGSGVATFEAGFHGFLVVEADDLLAAAIGLVPGSEREHSIMMYRPGTVNVTADPKIARFEVTLSALHPRRTRVVDGVGRFTHVHPGMVSLNVSTTGLVGSVQGELLEDPGHVTLHLPLKRTSQVFVTVLTEAGLPVPGASASLSTPLERVEATATEEGQRLSLGPVGEGPSVLRVLAPGFRARTQSLELSAGESDLEVVLTEAPKLRGRIVDTAGAPVAQASVQVRDEAVNQPQGSVTGLDGRFELAVEEEGTWQVEAISEAGEVGRVAAVVPGPEVTIRLEPLATASLTVLDPQRRPAEGARVMVASAESSEPDVGEVPESGVLEFTELVPGLYRYEVDDGASGERFLAQKGEFVVRPQEHATVTVQLRAGVALLGKLVDPNGSPVPFATLTSVGPRGSMTETDERGEFTIAGLEPGVEVELAIDHPDFGALSPRRVRPTSTRITFKANVGPRVVGRVVDGAGAPVVDFVVNDREVSSQAGAFDVPASSGVLTIRDFEGGEAMVEIKGRADVGEVVIRRGGVVSGVVLDEQRRPLPSVEVTCPDCLNQVITDAAGRFEAQLSRPVDTIRLEARLGDLGVVEQARVSAAPIELVLRPPTRVDGVVRGQGGRPVVTTVIITDPTGDPLEIDTDGQGQFSVALTAGRWVFGTRAFRTASVVVVSGRTQRVELGAPAESCEVRVSSAPLPSAVVIVPAGLEASLSAELLFSDLSSELAEGAIALGSDGAAFVGRGLPCGAITVYAAYGLEAVTTKATLVAGPNIVTVSAPSLMPRDTFGFRVPNPVSRDVEAVVRPE